jgi:hypothetical protein
MCPAICCLLVRHHSLSSFGGASRGRGPLLLHLNSWSHRKSADQNSNPPLSFFVGCFKLGQPTTTPSHSPPPPPQPPRLSALLPYVYNTLLRVVSWIPGTNTAALSGWGQSACRPPKPWPPPRPQHPFLTRSLSCPPLISSSQLLSVHLLLFYR